MVRPDIVVMIDDYSKKAFVDTIEGPPTAKECMSKIRQLDKFFDTFPRRVIVDQGRVFTAGDFQDLVKGMNAELRFTGTAAHWQNGVAERHIGDLGNRMTAALHEYQRSIAGGPGEMSPTEIARRMQNIVKAHNQWPRSRGGSSPNEIVFRYPTWVDSDIIQYRPEVETIFLHDSAEKIEADKREIVDGPSVGDLWIRPIENRNKGHARHTVVQVLGVDEKTGMVDVKDTAEKGRPKRLVVDQLLRKVGGPDTDSAPENGIIAQILLIRWRSLLVLQVTWRLSSQVGRGGSQRVQVMTTRETRP